jgi:hypothetical protein
MYTGILHNENFLVEAVPIAIITVGWVPKILSFFILKTCFFICVFQVTAILKVLGYDNSGEFPQT